MLDNGGAPVHVRNIREADGNIQVHTDAIHEWRKHAKM